MNAMATTDLILTPDDLLALPEGDRFELVDGHLVELHVSALSSLVALELGSQLRNHSRMGDLGWIFGPDLGYRFFPDRPSKVRKPDVSFIRRDRLAVEALAEGYVTIAPDLIVEVVSPNDEAEELEGKIVEYLDAGVGLVWVVYPTTRTAYAIRRDGSASRLGPGDELDGGDVLPGFHCRLGDLFPTIPAR